MDEKEKAAEAARLLAEVAAKAEADAVAEAGKEVTLMAAKDAEIERITKERDNYKSAALLRKGKLPADSEILGEDFDVFLQERVKAILADKEIAKAEADKQSNVERLARENSELRLALKNRPGGGIGGSSETGSAVKDNVFSEAQLTSLRQRALRLKADPEKFIEKAKENLLKGR